MNKCAKKSLKDKEFKKIYFLKLKGNSIRNSIYRNNKVEMKLVVSNYLKWEVSGDLDFHAIIVTSIFTGISLNWTSTSEADFNLFKESKNWDYHYKHCC